MRAIVHALAQRGVEADPVRVEVDHYSGHPGTVIVGLGDKAVLESKQRVRSALKNINIKYPRGKVVVNLAPANITKNGSMFDLSIAVGLMCLGRSFRDSLSPSAVFLGELSLGGDLRPIDGTLSLVRNAKNLGYQTVFLPSANAEEASYVEGIEIFALDHLNDLAGHLNGAQSLNPYVRKQSGRQQVLPSYEVRFEDIYGQESVKRALEIAAAGRHNILMNGAPGSGKTLLAKALASILPPLIDYESLEVTQLYSLAGQLRSGRGIIRQCPVRKVHHSVSRVALIGGGRHPKPGEISLAHRGVLFLDEFAEFPRAVLDLLRQPLEEGNISIMRQMGCFSFPARFMLCAAMNPCPCGYSGLSDSATRCTCTPSLVRKYSSRVSGPLLDRIDLRCTVNPVTSESLQSSSSGETSATIRRRVVEARTQQQRRFNKLGTGCSVNAEMSSKDISAACHLSTSVQNTLMKAVDALNLSARSYYRTIAVSRTIADLEGAEHIEDYHVLEALQYR